jgi:hypothetical protein
MSDKKEKNDATLSDYCLVDNDDQSVLSNFERLTLIGGKELEKAIAWFSKQLTRFNYLEQFGVLNVAEIKKAADYYDTDSLRSNPEAFYIFPDKSPSVIEKVIHGLADGKILDLNYESSYQAQHPEIKERYHNYHENKIVHARLWKHMQNNRPTIIAVHGWTMGDQRINSLAFQPGYLYRLGFNVALFELPFHGRRMPKAGLNSAVFPSTDFVMTNEAVAQAISDLRQLKLYLNLISSDIGIMGMSLGGYVCSLWNALDTHSFCIPIVPLVSMTDLAWQIVLKSNLSELYVTQGLTKELFDSIYFVHSPLHYISKIDTKRLMIVAGLSDQVVPPIQAELLWEHWSRPMIYWFEGGHVAEADKSRVFPEIARFFRGLNLISTDLS